MKHVLLASLALAAGMVVPVVAQTPAAPAHQANRVSGQVTAVDKTTRTVTVQPRQTTTTTAFTLGPNARIVRVDMIPIGSLKTNNVVQVGGTVTGTSVDARSILVLPALPKHHGGRNIVGTVAGTTPSLTVSADGQTYTVTTTPRTRVGKRVPGDLDDIKPGVNVNARVTGTAPSLVATEVSVTPARERRARRAGRLRLGGASAGIL